MDELILRARARRFPALHLALFLATVATTLWAGYGLSPLVARPHGVLATLPYFIPIPFGAGTLGAVIRMRSQLPSRRAALDIAAAGPIAGLVVAVPLLLWGLAHSELQAVSGPAVGSAMGSPYALVRALLQGAPVLSGEPTAQFFGDSLLTVAAARLVHGALPAGMDLALHPVAFAAWLGLLVTTLNLMPMGQLDGGHVLYSLLGRRLAHAASPARVRRALPRRDLPLLELARLVGRHPVRGRAPAPALAAGGGARPRSGRDRDPLPRALRRDLRSRPGLVLARRTRW